MMNLRERWRAGPQEFVILAGLSIGFAANAALLALTFSTDTAASWQNSVAVFGTGMLLAILAALVLKRRRARTTKSFVLVGVVATALAVLSYAGLIGGGVALAGSTWGILRASERSP